MRLSSPDWITPGFVMSVARCGVIATLVLIAVAYSQSLAPPAVAALLAYLLSVALILGFPAIRSADLVATAAIFMTSAESAASVGGAPIDIWRWMVTMAAIGGCVVPLRAQGLRGLALSNPYRPLERRRRHKREATRSAAAPRPHQPDRAPALTSQTVLLLPATIDD
jgi:hypothetical protein